MMIGGGGFVGLALSPKGLVVLEMALEAGAALSVNLGVASGSVSMMIGVYLRLEGQEGSLTGYLRIRGEMDVLGLISASITLELALTYHFPSGKMIGRASVVVEIDVVLVSYSVSVSCERRLAGSNGDPTYADVLTLDSTLGSAPEWDAYCAAFAPE
jgi:cobalamin synthase